VLLRAPQHPQTLPLVHNHFAPLRHPRPASAVDRVDSRRSRVLNAVLSGLSRSAQKRRGNAASHAPPLPTPQIGIFSSGRDLPLPRVRPNVSLCPPLTPFARRGVTASFVTLEVTSRRKRPFDWFAFLLFRWLRYTPALVGLLLLYFVLPLCASGPIFAPNIHSMYFPCERFFWRNLLYVNNFFDNTGNVFLFSHFRSNSLSPKTVRDSHVVFGGRLPALRRLPIGHLRLQAPPPFRRRSHSPIGREWSPPRTSAAPPLRPHSARHVLHGHHSLGRRHFPSLPSRESSLNTRRMSVH
jgi:hypothetical protein